MWRQGGDRRGGHRRRTDRSAVHRAAGHRRHRPIRDQDRALRDRARSFAVCRLRGELSALVQERCFFHLKSPIRRVTGWDTPYPHAFEWDYFPGPARVAKALEAGDGGWSMIFLDGIACAGEILRCRQETGEGCSGAIRTSPSTNLRRKRSRPLRGYVPAGARCVATLDRWALHRSSRRSLRVALAGTQRRLFPSKKIML